MIGGSEYETDGEKRRERRGSQESAAVGVDLLNTILAIGKCTTLDEAFESLLNAALDLTKMDGGGVYRVEGDLAVLRYHRGLPEAFIRRVKHRPLTLPSIQVFLTQREPVEIGEISPSMKELCRTYDIQHAFCFPLRTQGIPFGFLNIGSTRLESPARADIRAVQILVNQVEALCFRLYSEKTLRENEERFEAFMDNSPAVAWMRDEQGRYVYLSRSYTRRTGRSLDGCRGKTAFDLWPREIAEGFWKIDQEVLRTGRPVELMEEVPAPDGGRSYWWNIKFPFQDSSGRRFVGGIGVDITQRRRLEEELQRMNERLEEQVQARTEELNRTVAQLHAAMGELRHRADQLQTLTQELVQAEDRERMRLAEFLHDDLQQTLAAAKFQLGILDGQIGHDGAARETLGQAIHMLKEAIGESRNLSHEFGPPVLYCRRLDAIFEWLADQMEHNHGLSVHVDIRGRVEAGSEAVRSFLYRTAQEILFNATKHARVKEARLRLRQVREELRLTISDKGRGFDPNSLKETAGFGLSTIRWRVELLRGRMKIRSAPGKGSTFFIAVPDARA